MIVFLFLGLFLGLIVGWFGVWSSRRELIRLDEEKQKLKQEKRIVFDFMHSMVEAIGEGITREEFFQRVVHSSIVSTGATSACVFERNGEVLKGVAIEGLFPPHRPLPESSKTKETTRAKFLEEILRSEEFLVGEGLVGEVTQTKRGILIEDATKDPRIVVHDDPVLKVRSAVVVPISFQDNVIGVLAMVNPSDGQSFSESDFSLAKSVAEQAGLAIHNLDLMALQIEKNKLDSELGLAEEIQSMLLPNRFPDYPELGIAAVYKPAQKVGGDLYDVFDLEDGKVGLAVADVSGKGIPASLLMAICQSNLRHFARMYERPSDVLKNLNKVLFAEMKPNMFITIIFAIIDIKAEKIQLARAGHEQPMIVHKKSGEEEWRGSLINSEGMALGMVPSELFDAAIEDKEIPFCSGDIFALYTDGITETANADGTEYSSSRLLDALTSLRVRTPELLVNDVMNKLSLFSGNEGQADDITLLLAKRN